MVWETPTLAILHVGCFGVNSARRAELMADLRCHIWTAGGIVATSLGADTAGNKKEAVVDGTSGNGSGGGGGGGGGGGSGDLTPGVVSGSASPIELAAAIHKATATGGRVGAMAATDVVAHEDREDAGDGEEFHVNGTTGTEHAEIKPEDESLEEKRDLNTAGLSLFLLSKRGECTHVFLALQRCVLALL